MKKYLALFLTIALACTFLSGCSDSKKTDETTTAAAGTTAAGTTAAVEETTAAGETTTQAEAALPDEVPADLTDVPLLNSYASNLYIDYVKPNIFTSQVFSEEEKANARKALKLIIEAETKAIALYDKNPSIYYLRGKAYAESYADTKDPAMKAKGLADFQKALDLGLTMAQGNYDALSAAE